MPLVGAVSRLLWVAVISFCCSATVRRTFSAIFVDAADLAVRSSGTIWKVLLAFDALHDESAGDGSDGSDGRGRAAGEFDAGIGSVESSSLACTGCGLLAAAFGFCREEDIVEDSYRFVYEGFEVFETI